MPIVFGRKVLLPLLARLVEQHPGLELDVRLSDAYSDLVKDGIDVAVRVGELNDSTLVAKRFASQDMVLCAGPGYLKSRGMPQRVTSWQRTTLYFFGCRPVDVIAPGNCRCGES
jgi:DNA-binding transcriptional LysR family regulator